MIHKFASVSVVAALVFVLASGCGGDGGGTNPSARSGDGFTVSLNVSPSATTPGSRVRFTLTVKNDSGDLRTFTLPTAQEYEFIVYLKSGGQLWRWSSGKMFAQARKKQVISAGGSREFSVDWSAPSGKGGSYQVEGFYMGLPKLRPRAPLEIAPK